MPKKEFIYDRNSAGGSIGKYTYISSGLYEEKKSKFYSYIFRIESELEALEIIKDVRNEFKDARHVVYSYIIADMFKYSDDGEPSGTAGKMIYSLLEKQEITNILVIVVRYFGGILLGTGPLSRAYLKATKFAEDGVKLIEYIPKELVTISIDYKDEDELRNIIENTNSDILNVEYKENITYKIKVPKKDINLLNKYQKTKKMYNNGESGNT